MKTKVLDDFQICISVALNHEQIKSNPERISNIKPFIIHAIRKKQTFHHIKITGKDSNQIINQLLLISYTYHTTFKEIRHAYDTRKNHVLILMITDGEKWRYLAVKILSALFCRITMDNFIA